MKALLLAAGEGTRLRPLTLDRPKPMVPIAGRPLLEHLVGLLSHHGVIEIAINLHYRPEAIVDHFGDGHRFGVSITYSHEHLLLGSAGAAKKLSWFLDETFIVIYGDVLTDIDLSDLAVRHLASGRLLTMALHRVPDPTRCGIAQIDSSGQVLRFIEKPSADAAFSDLANAGIYVVEPRALHYIPDGDSFDFGHDLFPKLLEQLEPIQGWVTDGYVLDIGSAERYADAEQDARDGRVRLHSSVRVEV